MFGGDDDDDFVPANNSKLASLFSSKSTGEGNTSLTYTAPKQPKRIGNSSNDIRSSKTQTTAGSSNLTNTVQPSAANKLGIIIVKAVNTYKLEDRSYNLQGKLGAAVLGNAAACVYQLLLYKGKQHHITSAKITPKFQFTVQPNNYGTFYDDQKQNWSIHFDQEEDAEEFAKEIGLARGNSQGGNGEIHDLLIQDLSTGEGPLANVGDSVEIFYSVRLFTESKLGQLVESNLQGDKPQRVKIRKNVWEEGLIGATKGSKRIILLPPSLMGPWKQEVPPGASLAVEVEIGRLKQGRSSSREGTPAATSALADSGESAVDSGTDETSIRARGEALTASPQTHKANIITRMAKMGQATLPLKGAVTCNPSDTEDSEEEVNSSTKPPVVFVPSPKVRSAKTPQMPPHPISPPESHAGGSNNMNVPPQQMAVYQSLPAWQQQSQAYTVGQYGIGQLDGQLYPLVPNQTMSSHQLMSSAPSIGTPPGMPSSTDGHLSVFLSETRTHNTEVRIGMAKVADKVDQVLAKLDSTVHTLRPSMSSALLDSTSLLASIQRLVSENEQLKSEVTEKGNKIDVQNDRIYQLLNTNHKYLEQSNTSSNDQRNHEAVVTGLRQERAQLLEDLGEAREEAKRTQAQLEGYKRETANVLAQHQEELAKSKSAILEQDTSLQGLTENLKMALEAQDTNEQKITTLTKTLLETQGSNDELKASLNEVTRRLEHQKIEADQEIQKLNAKHSAQLEELQVREANIRRNSGGEKKPSEPLSQKVVVDEVKKVMNVVYKSLHREFTDGKTYLGESIKATLMVTIRDITCQLIEKETFATPVSTKSQTVRPNASQSQLEKSQSVTGNSEVVLKENVVVSLDSHSDAVEGPKRTENDVENENVSTGCSGKPRDLSVVVSEPLSKPAVNLPIIHDILRTETSPSSNGINQIQINTSVIPSVPHFNTVEDLNPTADGPKDVYSSSSSSMMSNYAGGNAGDIPTVRLAKLPGEIDLSVKLIPTDSDIVPESFSHLRVTSDSCVLGTPTTPKVQDDNIRHESMSAVIPDSTATARPVTAAATIDTLQTEGQQLSTKEITTTNLRESSLERKPWRSEPPPLFDDDEDEDDWLS